MKLSILVPTMPSRAHYLKRLKRSLKDQVNPDVELLIFEGDPGQSIGSKRNALLDMAKGDYVAFVDDDDIVAHHYVSSVLKAIESNPDVVGIHLLHYEDYALRGLTYHSLRFSKWYDEPNQQHPNLKNYYRNPNHINPVKRELALQVKFPEINMGEDKDYSMRLKPLLSSEVYISDPIYAYLFRSIK
jgi:glycosyltransferase involved in cell wall biosynthesis